MGKVVRAIITNHRFPHSIFHLYFQLHHKSDHLPFISFVVMQLGLVLGKTTAIVRVIRGRRV